MFLILTSLLHVRDCHNQKQTVANIKDPGVPVSPECPMSARTGC